MFSITYQLSGSLKNNFALGIDPSLAALRKLEICLTFLKFSRFASRAPQHPKMFFIPILES